MRDALTVGIMKHEETCEVEGCNEKAAHVGFITVDENGEYFDDVNFYLCDKHAIEAPDEVYCIHDL